MIKVVWKAIDGVSLMDAEAQILAELAALRNAIEGLDAKVSSLEYSSPGRSEASNAQLLEKGNSSQRQIGEAEATGYVVSPQGTVESLPESSVCGEDWGTLAGKDIASLVVEGRKGEQLLAELIRVYSDFPEVRAIAVGAYLEEIRVFVLLDCESHDHELLGRLIDADYGLCVRYQPLCLSMSYPEVGDARLDTDSYMHGTIVWRRGSE